ncbi:MAG: hypothetical protein R2815_10080 [Flavobacteriales bacterium]|nr:STAS/SEC14 domain-containing protein [Flavobacteriales bacterium]
MTIEPTTRQTEMAVLTRLRPDYLEVHYRKGCVFNTTGLQEVQEARRDLMGSHPYGMLSLLPDDADFELSAMNVDHLAKDRKDGAMLAVAVVAPANMLEMVLKLYFSYFPQNNRVKVCSDEAEARSWIQAQLEEVARTGS